MIAPWIQTFTGKAFDLFDPKPAQVCIDDIAHSLANIARFGGHTKRFYCVAEHSYEMSCLIESDDCQIQMAALLHDAHEAYLGDITAPLGAHVLFNPPGHIFVPLRLSDLKAKIQEVIHHALGLSPEHIHHPLIREADLKMLAAEKRDLMGPEPFPWIELPAPYKQSFKGEWQWDWAEVFKERFHKLKSVMPEVAP